jgi:hypothetical protein
MYKVKKKVNGKKKGKINKKNGEKTRQPEEKISSVLYNIRYI